MPKRKLISMHFAVLVIIHLLLYMNCNLPINPDSASSRTGHIDTLYSLSTPLVAPGGDLLLFTSSYYCAQETVVPSKYPIQWPPVYLYADIRIVVTDIAGQVVAEKVLCKEKNPDTINYEMKSINDSLVLISCKYGYFKVYNYKSGELYTFGPGYYPWAGWSVMLLSDSRVFYCTQEFEGVMGNLVWHTEVFTGDGNSAGVERVQIPGRYVLAKGLHTDRNTAFLFSAATNTICFVDSKNGTTGKIIPFYFGYDFGYRHDAYAVGDSSLFICNHDTVSFYRYDGTEFKLTLQDVLPGLSISQNPFSADGSIIAYIEFQDSLSQNVVVGRRDSLLTPIGKFSVDKIVSQLSEFNYKKIW